MIHRVFWESKGSKKTLLITDELLKLVNEIEPKAALKYNKYYIGLEVDGAAFNLVSFVPRKTHVIMMLRLKKTEETDRVFEEIGLDVLTHDTRGGQYNVRIEQAIDQPKRELFLCLIRQTRDGFGR